MARHLQNVSLSERVLNETALSPQTKTTTRILTRKHLPRLSTSDHHQPKSLKSLPVLPSLK